LARALQKVWFCLHAYFIIIINNNNNIIIIIIIIKYTPKKKAQREYTVNIID